MPFPFDLFEQALTGNWVAYATIILGVALIGVLCFVVFLWKKLPQLAKGMFVNETVGGHNPIVMQCLETRKVRFRFPTMTRNGFTYDYKTGSIGISPKLWTERKDLTNDERDTIEGIYSTENSNVPLFVQYSVQAFIANPEVTAFMQNSENMKKFAKDGAKIDKKKFIELLQQARGNTINFKALTFDFPIDITHLKTALSESISDSDFIELENKIRQDERGNQNRIGLGGIVGIAVLALVIIDIVLNFIA